MLTMGEERIREQEWGSRIKRERGKIRGGKKEQGSVTPFSSKYNINGNSICISSILVRFFGILLSSEPA